MDGRCSVKLHSARSTGGRVIWPEIWLNGTCIENTEDLRQEDAAARLEWALIGTNGIRMPLDPKDERIESGGFLLRIPERDVRSGVRAECSIVIDEAV
jgi:hypothetical protein